MLEGKDFILEITRQGSFTRAAQALFVTQPALSASVRKLEEKLGFTIFDRSRQPVTPTPEGTVYISALEELEALEKRTEVKLNSLRDLEAGSLCVGGSSLYASVFLPQILNRFRTRYPKISLSIREGSTTRLTELITAGEIDVFLDNCELPERLASSAAAAEEHLWLAVPEILAKKYDLPESRSDGDRNSSPALSSLGRLPMILLKKGNDTTLRFSRICRQAHFTPNIVLEPEQLMTAYNMAACGLGATVISDLMVKALPYSASFRYYPLSGPDAVRTMKFFWRPQSVTPTLKKFLKAAVDEP